MGELTPNTTGKYAAEALVSNTPSTPFRPSNGDCWAVLSGTGSVTVTFVFSNDGAAFYPEAVATDGGAPILMNKVAYNGATQNGIRIPLTGKFGQIIKASPGVVTGTVSIDFEQR